MKTIEVLLTQQTIQLIGWALLHSLWQGIIIVTFLKIATIFLPKNSANVRYILAYVSLVLMLLLPISMSWVVNRSAVSVVSVDSVNQIRNSLETESRIFDPSKQNQTFQENTSLYSWTNNLNQIENFFPMLVNIWFFGILIFSLRWFGMWKYTQKLRKGETQSELKEWQPRLEYLCASLEIRKAIILLESSLVKVPTVVGWIKPVILIPPSALVGLTPQQFESILVHELAHIRRNDYLANLLQTVIETLLFYHPAVWWVSDQIRSERENCCDDIAVSVGGNAVMYARALTQMERLRKASPHLAMAADGGSLAERIHRLVGIRKKRSLRKNSAWTSIFVIALLITIVAISQISSSTNAAVQKIQDSGSKEIETSKSQNPDEQAAEICGLGKKGDLSAIPLLVQSLGDETKLSKSAGCWNSGDWSPRLQIFNQPTIGEESAIALASLGEAAVVPLVAAVNNSDANVRRNAAWAIGEIRDGDKINRSSFALGSLISALKDANASVRRAAAFALSEIKDKRASVPLIDALNDENPDVREMAANALGEMKEPRAINSLQAALDDQEQRVKIMAKWALDEIQDQ